MATGANTAALDFDSVQRGNPEMQRRAQEVIDRCWQAVDDEAWTRTRSCRSTTSAPAGCRTRSPSSSKARDRGARFDLARVPLDASGLSPREIWSNESQERYVLAIAPDASRRSSPRSARASAARTRSSASRRDGPRAEARCATRRRRRSTCRWTCCSASRRRCIATRRTSPRCTAPIDLDGPRARDDRARRADASDRRQQELPRHDRRPHGRRPDRRATRWSGRGRCRSATARSR